MSQVYHDVVERPGFHIPHRRMHILAAGQPADFVIVGPTLSAAVLAGLETCPQF